MSDAESLPTEAPVEADTTASIDAEGDRPADAVLVESRALARAALLEVTPEATIGADAGHTVEGEHVLSLRFAGRLEGYVGWFWTVTVARVDDEDPTVLEISLLPGDGALVAPDWVPWSERLAEYRASQEAAAEEGASEGDGDDDTDRDDEDPDDELDESDLGDDDLDIDDVETVDTEDDVFDDSEGDDSEEDDDGDSDDEDDDER